MSMIGPRLKLARSLEHINVLSEEIVAFMKNNPPTVKAGKAPDGAYLARVNFVPAPARLGILAADVFQTLRASLDYLAWELALLNMTDGFPHKRTEFPICGKWDRDGKAHFNAVTKSLSQDARDEIQALQPYHRGDSYKIHPLWVLNFFCNIAKHRSIPMAGYKIDMDLPPGTTVNALDSVTIEIIVQDPEKDFKPNPTSYSISFGGLREAQGMSLSPHEFSTLYNFVVSDVFPRFVHFFK